MLGLRHVTIEAKDLESGRKALLDEPGIELPPRLGSSKQLLTMLVSMAFDMVDGEEVSVGFTTACTFCHTL
jgi:hypothetical protein